ncbi:MULTISPECIES: Maff2 family mobile element protein [unclassified Butyrivibrio]|uniref:Maff2 family mobile element protein n=1 Tax=unclassified Butyrivibrio TaxID=2639466 RepID=UPI0009DC3856|nr:MULTISPECIES: Maff2 family protein [unclassified Butyrivibrio]
MQKTDKYGLLRDWDSGIKMEFFKSGVDLLQTVVTLLGAAAIIGGLVEVGKSQADNNPAIRATGISMFVGGAIIIAVGLTLVPKLKDMVNGTGTDATKKPQAGYIVTAPLVPGIRK